MASGPVRPKTSSWSTQPQDVSAAFGGHRPEIDLRCELHGRGLRYRVHRRTVPEVRRRLGIVFGPTRTAVEVRGCFWHACDFHGNRPRANAEWWDRKLSRNRQRDQETEAALRAAGWYLVVVWAHEDPVHAADRVEATVLARRRACWCRPVSDSTAPENDRCFVLHRDGPRARSIGLQTNSVARAVGMGLRTIPPAVAVDPALNGKVLADRQAFDVAVGAEDRELRHRTSRRTGHPSTGQLFSVRLPPSRRPRRLRAQ